MKIHVAYSSPCQWQDGESFEVHKTKKWLHTALLEKSKSPVFQTILFTASLKPKIFTVASKLKVYLVGTLSEVEAQAQQHVYGVNIVKLPTPTEL